MTNPSIALSSWVCKYPDDLIDITLKYGFTAIEWDLNFIPIPLSINRRRKLKNQFIDNGIKIRFHLPYSSYDLAHSDTYIRSLSRDVLIHNIKLLNDFETDLIVLHYACQDENTDSFSILSEVIDCASEHGIIVGIENLLLGPTSDPRMLRNIIMQTKCKVTLDVGHANVSNKLYELINMVKNEIYHIHLYNYEDAKHNHCPFDDISQLSSVLKIIQSLPSKWWTIEMDNMDEIIKLKRWISQLLDEIIVH